MNTILRVLLIVASASAFAQSNEVILLGQYGGYDPDVHPGDRLLGMEFYAKVSPAWKVFAGGVIQQRFGEQDRSLGAGAYFIPDRQNSFFANLQIGFSPVVIPGADISVEYTRALGQVMTASLLYRYMGFHDATVHIVAPSTTLYAFPGWLLTVKVFLSNLVGSNTLTGSFLAQVWYEPSETWSPGISYAVGNESYRAGSLADVTTAASWSTSVGGKFRVSDSVRLRLSLEHVNRIGAYQLNTLFLAVTYGW